MTDYSKNEEDGSLILVIDDPILLPFSLCTDVHILSRMIPSLRSLGLFLRIIVNESKY